MAAGDDDLQHSSQGKGKTVAPRWTASKAGFFTGKVASGCHSIGRGGRETDTGSRPRANLAACSSTARALIDTGKPPTMSEIR
jgi:hypothetical protein